MVQRGARYRALFGVFQATKLYILKEMRGRGSARRQSYGILASHFGVQGADEILTGGLVPKQKDVGLRVYFIPPQEER